jgi:hypothetical protein
MRGGKQADSGQLRREIKTLKLSVDPKDVLDLIWEEMKEGGAADTPKVSKRSKEIFDVLVHDKFSLPEALGVIGSLMSYVMIILEENKKRSELRELEAKKEKPEA